MTNQKTPKYFVEPNKFSMLSAKLTLMAQKKQAEGMADKAADHENLALKILAVKEKNRKVAEAFAAKENKKKKN